MSKYLQLQVPNGCSENWHHMLPQQGGRRCFSCQKKVVDFTAMTDHELVQFFRSTDRPVCGRFTAAQLNRNLSVPRTPQPWVKYFVSITLPALLLSLKAAAEVAKSPFPTQIAPQQQTTNLASAEDTITTATGLVQDENGAPIPYATIMLKGTNRGTQADSAGRFLLTDIKAPATLVVSSVGYMSQEVQVAAGHQQIQLRLQLTEALLGEVVIVGYPVIKKLRKKEKTPKADRAEAPQRMLVYPNPVAASSRLNIQCQKLPYGNYVLQLYNAAGVQVHHQKLTYNRAMQGMTLPMPALPAGNYFLKLVHEQKGNSYQEQLIITL